MFLRKRVRGQSTLKVSCWFVRIVIALKAVKEDCLGLEKDYLRRILTNEKLSEVS